MSSLCCSLLLKGPSGSSRNFFCLRHVRCSWSVLSHFTTLTSSPLTILPVSDRRNRRYEAQIVSALIRPCKMLHTREKLKGIIRTQCFPCLTVDYRLRQLKSVGTKSVAISVFVHASFLVNHVLTSTPHFSFSSFLLLAILAAAELALPTCRVV